MVSVIIPTYNSAKYICEAIDSVLSQTYRDYEVIVIDDGSTDDTGRLIAERYPDVHYYFAENRGVASARNQGLLKARGEFIAFLDADDRWLPEKLEKQVQLMQSNHRLGMVFTENSFFSERGTIHEVMNKRERLMQGDIVRNIFLKSYVATPTVMVRKDVFDAVGVFEEGLVVAEDDNMWMRIGMQYEIGLIDEPLVQVRISEGSLCRNWHNILHGVKTHIDIIKKKYPDICRRVGESAIRRKLSDLLFCHAYYYFSDNNFREARKYYIKSYLYCPFRIKLLMYVASSYFPQNLVIAIRKVKRYINMMACRSGKRWF